MKKSKLNNHLLSIVAAAILLLTAASDSKIEDQLRPVSTDTLAAQAIALSDSDEQVERQLMDLIGNKRIVMIGENDHYISDKFDLQLRLIKILHRHGFRNILVEAGFGLMQEVDRHFASNTSIPRTLPLFSSQPVFLDANYYSPKDIAFEARGYLTSLRGELYWFFQELHRLSQAEPSRRLKISGFDIDFFHPNTAHQHFLGLLRTEVRDQIQGKCGSVTFPSLDQQADDLPQLERYLACCEDKIADVSSAARMILRSLRIGVNYRIHERTAKSTYARLKFREWYLIANAKWHLANFDTNKEKYIIIGHNLHVAKDYRAIWMSRKDGSKSDRNLWPNFGTAIHNDYPGQVFVIGSTYGRGTHSGLYCQQRECSVSFDPGSIENLLSKQEPIALSTDVLNVQLEGDPIKLRNNAKHDYVDLHKAFHLLIYQPQVRASQKRVGH